MFKISAALPSSLSFSYEKVKRSDSRWLLPKLLICWVCKCGVGNLLSTGLCSNFYQRWCNCKGVTFYLECTLLPFPEPQPTLFTCQAQFIKVKTLCLSRYVFETPCICLSSSTWPALRKNIVILRLGISPLHSWPPWLSFRLTPNLKHVPRHLWLSTLCLKPHSIFIFKTLAKVCVFQSPLGWRFVKIKGTFFLKMKNPWISRKRPRCRWFI